MSKTIYVLIAAIVAFIALAVLFFREVFPEVSNDKEVPLIEAEAIAKPMINHNIVGEISAPDTQPLMGECVVPMVDTSTGLIKVNIPPLVHTPVNPSAGYTTKPESTVAIPTDPLLEKLPRDEFNRFVVPSGLPTGIQSAVTKKIIDFQTSVNGGFAPVYWDGTPAYDENGNKMPEPPNTDKWNAFVAKGKSSRGRTLKDMEDMSHIIDQNRAAMGLDPLHQWGY